jgi:hypothetical protein
MSENGVVTGKAQTEWATRILQRPVGSLEALTKREASAVIDRVKAGPPADQPEQEPEEAF